MMKSARDASVGAVRYLRHRQADDGHWEDYQLPTGVSDAWVTAYVGLALHEISAQDHVVADPASDRAARWLIGHRPYPAGWGYNDHTGPDADSTALALTLVKAAGYSALPDDEAWLRARWCADGGFATYEGPGAWGTAHPDVTPSAYLALGHADREELRQGVIDFLLRWRLPDGTWPAYWWRSNLYSTRATLDLFARLDLLDCLDDPATSGNLTIETNLERALALEISLMRGERSVLASRLATDLVERQRPDGSWPGGYDLRVTKPTCYSPWVYPEGRLYRDEQGLLTTASAARALARFARW